MKNQKTKVYAIMNGQEKTGQIIYADDVQEAEKELKLLNDEFMANEKPGFWVSFEKEISI